MPTMSKKKPDGKPKRVRHGFNLNLWIGQQVGEAFAALVDGIEPRTNKSAYVEMLIREHLKAKGLWPPPAESEPKQPERAKE